MQEDYLQITAPVFNIQSYSIHDGPGIRTTVFMKGCPLRCRWCANPESQMRTPQLMCYGNRCTACGRCVRTCSAGAIAIKVRKDKPIAVTDRSLCISCGQCVNVCQSDAREITGEMMSVGEVLKKVLEDRLFMESSGGGMTVSGGEPLLHSDFTEALFRAAKEAGLHTAVESSCYADRRVIQRIFHYVDFAMLDIKHMDAKAHQILTGVSNRQILENLKYIYHKLKVPFMVSIPVVPAYNDSDENIAATSRFVADELGHDVPVRLLPYHRLGESKNESLGKEMDLSIEIPSDEHMQHLKSMVESFGLQTQIGG